MQQISPGNDNESAQDENSLGDLLYKFLPYWPFFVILLIIFISGAWLYLRYKLPIYQSTATILIKEDKNGAASTDIMNAFDMFSSKKSVENEVEILQSKTLMREVVRNLDLYAPIYTKGRVVNQSAYLTSPIVIEAKAPDSLRYVSKVRFLYDAAANLVEINKKKYPLNQWVVTDYGTLDFLPNRYFKKTSKGAVADAYYFSLNSIQNTANSILGQLKVTPSNKQSTVIDLSIEGEVPALGENILNELLAVYNKAAILDKNILAANTLKFVEDRLKYVVNELDSVESRLQTYKSRNNVVDISSQGQIFLQTVAGNDEKISDINMQLAVLDQVQSYVSSKGGVGGIVPSTLGIQDPALTELLQKLSDLELQYIQTKKLVPENNPAVVTLVDAMDKIRPGILENIKSQRKNLMAGKNDLSATNNRYSSMLKTIPEKERELLGISRQQAIKNNIYTFLLQKREETALSFASAVADSRIIDEAESSGPIGPKRSFIYLIAGLSALFFGIIVIVLRDMLNRTVKDRTEIEKYTNIPFLGEIVYDRSGAVVVITEGKRSFIAEQFRQLRTSIGYFGVDESHKNILVTSSITSEGKSFIAINLGIGLALMGKKVALLELDLRKPKISLNFDIPRNAGLTNYLVGKAQPAEIIKNSGIENLFILPCGPIPPNPSELISNGKLEELLKYLDADFDYIIMDTAPVNPVTDAFILSSISDVTLFVIRYGYTPKIFVKNLEQYHKTMRIKNPAIIYNGIKGKGFNKYGYGYGYGYGYTTEDESHSSLWNRVTKKVFKRR